MRIPFPERILYSHALIFAIVLCGIQLLERTNPFFSGLCFCFILVSVAAFNIAGGVPYPSGSYIAFNAIFTLILPLCVKAVIGEPADSNLLVPVRVLEVYLAGMVSMFTAAVISRHFRARSSLVGRLMPMNDLRGAYLGSTILGVFLYFLPFVLPSGNGSLGSLVIQINRFPALALLLGPMATVRETASRRSMSPSNMFLVAVVSATGLLGFSKEAFLTPFFCWAVAVAVVGFRLRWINIVLFVVGGYITVTYMLPYAQVGRDYENPGLSQIQMSAYLLSHFDEVKEIYEEGGKELYGFHYYNNRLPLLDRLDVLSVDAGLIDFTDREGTFGFRPITASLENFVPHFLWANKSAAGYGNIYAHELGLLSSDDVYTGISFSPTADAYHEGQMIGVLGMECLVLTICFLLLDSIFGDVRLNPVGLLATVIIFRIAPEGLLTGLMVLLAQPLVAILFAAFFCAYILPVIANIIRKEVPEHATPPPAAGLISAPSGPS